MPALATLCPPDEPMKDEEESSVGREGGGLVKRRSLRAGLPPIRADESSSLRDGAAPVILSSVYLEKRLLARRTRLSAFLRLSNCWTACWLFCDRGKGGKGGCCCTLSESEEDLRLTEVLCLGGKEEDVGRSTVGRLIDCEPGDAIERVLLSETDLDFCSVVSPEDVRLGARRPRGSVSSLGAVTVEIYVGLDTGRGGADPLLPAEVLESRFDRRSEEAGALFVLETEPD